MRFWSIDDFPRFTNARSRRQAPAELRFESAPTPDAFHKKRFEGEGTGEIALGHLYERNCSDSEAGCDWFVVVDSPLSLLLYVLKGCAFQGQDCERGEAESNGDFTNKDKVD